MNCVLKGSHFIQRRKIMGYKLNVGSILRVTSYNIILRKTKRKEVVF